MLKWTVNETGSHHTLSGLMMNGTEGSIIVHKRYDCNYIFSCPELGIRLKLVEAQTSDELRDMVLAIVKERMISIAADIYNNISLIDGEGVAEVDLEKAVREWQMPA